MKQEPTIKVKVISDSRRGRFVFRWVDAEGSPRQETSKWPNKKTLRRNAEREAAELEQSLNAKQLEATDMAWFDFERVYAQEHLASLAVKSRKAWATAANHVNTRLKPAFLSDLTPVSLSRLAASWRAEQLSETSIDSYLATIRAALGWAVDMGYLDSCPRIRKPKRAKGKTKRMRSRPVTLEELERMLTVAPTVRPNDFEKYQQLLRGLWLGGLRVSEAIVLSWEFRSGFAIDPDGRRPMYRITSENQKSGQDQVLPIAPEFAEWLCERPDTKRRGTVFGIHFRTDTVVKHVSAIGKAAGVVVSPNGKTATAHDLRRSFGTRWAARVQPAILQQLMRHASIETTMQYYVDLNAAELADALWNASEVAHQVAQPSSELATKLPKSV
ncbi:tyrosine-type recombinase/integrase [Aeoliella sp.]|uniref:tyrosine-type recombinase/integrase n=1 Tax=Aeoliella sp. TaxID=2795800 RepID=UPI003CCC16E4